MHLPSYPMHSHLVSHVALSVSCSCSIDLVYKSPCIINAKPSWEWIYFVQADARTSEDFEKAEISAVQRDLFTQCRYSIAEGHRNTVALHQPLPTGRSNTGKVNSYLLSHYTKESILSWSLNNHAMILPCRSPSWPTLLQRETTHRSLICV